MPQVEMTASAVADVQDYYDQTDPVRALLWKRAVREGLVVILPEPEPKKTNEVSSVTGIAILIEPEVA